MRIITREEGEKIIQKILQENLFDDEVKRMVEQARENMDYREQTGNPDVGYPAYELNRFLETWW